MRGKLYVMAILVWASCKRESAPQRTGTTTVVAPAASTHASSAKTPGPLDAKPGDSTAADEDDVPTGPCSDSFVVTDAYTDDATMENGEPGMFDWVQLNRDGVKDAILASGCGTGGCMYSILRGCGGDRFVEIDYVDGDQEGPLYYHRSRLGGWRRSKGEQWREVILYDCDDDGRRCSKRRMHFDGARYRTR